MCPGWDTTARMPLVTLVSLPERCTDVQGRLGLTVADLEHPLRSLRLVRHLETQLVETTRLEELGCSQLRSALAVAVRFASPAPKRSVDRQLVRRALQLERIGAGCWGAARQPQTPQDDEPCARYGRHLFLCERHSSQILYYTDRFFAHIREDGRG